MGPEAESPNLGTHVPHPKPRSAASSVSRVRPVPCPRASHAVSTHLAYTGTRQSRGRLWDVLGRGRPRWTRGGVAGAETRPPSLAANPPGRPAPAAVFPSIALTCRPRRLGHPAKPLRGCGAVCWLPSQRPVRDTRLSSAAALPSPRPVPVLTPACGWCPGNAPIRGGQKSSCLCVLKQIT